MTKINEMKILVSQFKDNFVKETANYMSMAQGAEGIPVVSLAQKKQKLANQQENTQISLVPSDRLSSLSPLDVQWFFSFLQM